MKVSYGKRGGYMKLTVIFTYLGVICLLALAISACGGGSSSAGKAAVVKQVSTDDPNVAVGDDIDLNVDFSYSTDTVVHDNHNVIIVVRVPKGLQFEAGTARIDEIGGTDSVTPSIEQCQDGDAILRFDLGQNVLANATDPSGGADGRLIMALLGTQAVGTVSIEAAAGYDFETVTGSCSEGLVPQDTVPFSVL
jgi:hypothetical protein